MTVFGPDISSYQHGVNVRALTDEFVLLKCTEGTYYTDADYESWLAQAKASGKLAVAYHFVSGEDPDAQAAHLLAHIVDKTLPVMLDWEPSGTYRPTLAQLLAVADALVRHGLRPKLAYAPRWYWAQIGSPPLTGLSDRRMGLVSSAYPGGSNYPGDNAAGWSPYGGVTPILYQFTDVAVEGGQTVGDRNAYRGTIEQLAAFLGAATPTPSTSGASDMTYTIEAGWQRDYPDVAGALQQHMPVGTVLDLDHASAYGALRSFVAAERAAVIEQKLDQVLAKVGTPPAIDVNALAAAIAPHLAAGATADTIAAAVLHHLSADTANG
ncbi:MAG: hypothetical protein HOY79_20720 [Streptomyces sp.]|nr:hypothetical protein [Streptomyces sp.]